MSPEDLATLHPRLFHVTSPGALPGILRHGLLPTSALLDLFGVPHPARAEVEAARRPASVELRHAVHGTATIMDNVPLQERALASCLDDGLHPADWLRLLNARVFLWADEAGMARLLRARLNRTRPRDVLVFDTLGVARTCAGRVPVSAINSGSTLRRPARRGLGTFTPLERHPYAAWRRLRGQRDRILEVTVLGGIPDPAACLVDHWTVPGG